VPFFDASVELLPIAAARYASPDEIQRAELSDQPLAHWWKILTLA
jgi:hypothetical protein